MLAISVQKKMNAITTSGKLLPTTYLQREPSSLAAEDGPLCGPDKWFLGPERVLVFPSLPGVLGDPGEKALDVD